MTTLLNKIIPQALQQANRARWTACRIRLDDGLKWMPAFTGDYKHIEWDVDNDIETLFKPLSHYSTHVKIWDGEHYSVVQHNKFTLCVNQETDDAIFCGDVYYLMMICDLSNVFFYGNIEGDD